MKCVPLGDPPCKRRPNAKYDSARAAWIAKHAEHSEALEEMEERILAFPTSIGKVSKAAEGARHIHFADHYVVWWKHFSAAREVEFRAIGHHDDFFKK